MTKSRSDLSSHLPTHDDLLGTWSQLCNEAPEIGDPSMLILPENGGLAACAFYPSEDHPIAECIDAVVGTVLEQRIATPPWPWAALIAPAFLKTLSVAEYEDLDLRPGDLQRRYADGDEEVREVVCVTLVAVPSTVTSVTYAQPLLEQIGETTGAPGDRVEGPVVDALRRAIVRSILGG